MNETGNYPGIGGQPNADLVVVGITLLLTLPLALIPFIPGCGRYHGGYQSTD